MQAILDALTLFFTDESRLIPATVAAVISLAGTHRLKFLFSNPSWPQWRRNRAIEGLSTVLGWTSYVLVRACWQIAAGLEYSVAIAGIDIFVGLALMLSIPYFYKFLPADLKAKLSVETKIVRRADGNFEERDITVPSARDEETVMYRRSDQ